MAKAFRIKTISLLVGLMLNYQIRAKSRQKKLDEF